MLLNDPNKIIEVEEDEPRLKKKKSQKKSGKSEVETEMISIKGGKSGVKGQSGTTADTKFKPPSVTDYDEGDGADGDGDATSRGGDATS